MEYVKLIYDYKSYGYKGGSSIEMDILGCFLSSDVRCYSPSFRRWVLDNSSLSACSNITSLSKENGYVYLSDLYSEEEIPTELKMTVEQLVQILDDWQEKVCKAKPKEVIIKHENDQFIIETSS